MPQEIPGTGCQFKQQFSMLGKTGDDMHYSDYDISFYRLDISLERNSTYISGDVEIHAKALVNMLDSIFLELHNELSIDSVFVNAGKMPFTRTGNRFSVLVSPSLALGEVFIAKIFYHGLPPASTGFFSGIRSEISAQWGNEVTWTLSQPDNADQWFPCKQDLKDKADSAWIFITTDTSNMAGSNGRLTAIRPVNGGKHRFEWKTSCPIDYYLISAAVSDYQEYTFWVKLPGTSDSVQIVNYIYDAEGCLDYYRTDLELTSQFIRLFSSKFGVYPYANEKYGHCLVNISGGMEHQTMATMGSFNFQLNSHELSHQWFGDNVTCATWSDIWVNEGFATYSRYLAEEFLISRELADKTVKEMENYVMSGPGGSVYIPPDSANNAGRIFDGRLSYNKGAVILHVLRYEINDDSIFFEILKAYQEIYAGSTATGDDFIALAESFSGLDLQQYSQQWYYGEGYPEYDIRWFQNADTLYISSKQASSSSITPFFSMHVPFRLAWEGGDTIIRLEQNSDDELFKIRVNHDISLLEINPGGQTLLKLKNISRLPISMNDNFLFFAFPNPFDDELLVYFRQDGKPNRIRLADATGKVVFDEVTNKDHLNINTSELSKGLYLMIFRDNQASEKLIRK